MKEFFATLWGRILTVLAALAMLLGIGAEALSIYRSWQDSQIATNNIIKSRAEACLAAAKAIAESSSPTDWGKANKRIQAVCDPDHANDQNGPVGLPDAVKQDGDIAAALKKLGDSMKK
jgi:hypothetical protein